MRHPAAVLLSSLLAAGSAAATPSVAPFPAGAEAKVSGLESCLVTTGAPAALYNPANLNNKSSDAGKTEPYLELGLVNAVVSYEQPQFDPVVVKVTTPIATVGAAYTPRFAGGRLTLGGVVFPSAQSKEHIPGLPRKIGGTLQALVVDTSDNVADLGLGAGYRLAPPLTLGVGLDHSLEYHTLKAAAPGNPVDLADMSYHNQFDREVFGARLELPAGVTGAFAYRTEQVRPYKGSQLISANAQGETAPKVQSYVPETANLGVAVHRFGASLGLEAERQFWAKGRGVVKDGISADRPLAALANITQLSLTAGYQIPRGPVISAGYADLPSPWGDGEDDGILADHVHGADFGAFDNVDRRAVALGAVTKVLGGELATTLARTAGKRQVDAPGENIGYYTSTITTASAAYSRPF